MEVPSPCLQLVLMALLLGCCSCYKTGAPPEACNTLSPKHNSIPQASGAPYDISMERFKYSPGEAIHITLKGMTLAEQPTYLKGFMAMAVRQEEFTPVGTWSETPRSKVICTGGIAATHTDNVPKKDLTLIWNAPAQDIGAILIIVTFVENEKTYWVTSQSRPLTYTSQPGPAPPAITNPVIVPVTDPPTGGPPVKPDDNTDPPTDGNNGDTDPPTDGRNSDIDTPTDGSNGDGNPNKGASVHTSFVLCGLVSFILSFITL